MTAYLKIYLLPNWEEKGKGCHKNNALVTNFSRWDEIIYRHYMISCFKKDTKKKKARKKKKRKENREGLPIINYLK